MTCRMFNTIDVKGFICSRGKRPQGKRFQALYLDAEGKLIHGNCITALTRGDAFSVAKQTAPERTHSIKIGDKTSPLKEII